MEPLSGKDPWNSQFTWTRPPCVSDALFHYWRRLDRYGCNCRGGGVEAAFLHGAGCHLLHWVTAGQGISNQEWGLWLLLDRFDDLNLEEKITKKRKGDPSIASSSHLCIRAMGEEATGQISKHIFLNTKKGLSRQWWVRDQRSYQRHEIEHHNIQITYT